MDVIYCADVSSTRTYTSGRFSALDDVYLYRKSLIPAAFSHPRSSTYIWSKGNYAIVVKIAIGLIYETLKRYVP